VRGRTIHTAAACSRSCPMLWSQASGAPSRRSCGPCSLQHARTFTHVPWPASTREPRAVDRHISQLTLSHTLAPRSVATKLLEHISHTASLPPDPAPCPPPHLALCGLAPRPPFTKPPFTNPPPAG